MSDDISRRLAALRHHFENFTITGNGIQVQGSINEGFVISSGPGGGGVKGGLEVLPDYEVPGGEILIAEDEILNVESDTTYPIIDLTTHFQFTKIIFTIDSGIFDFDVVSNGIVLASGHMDSDTVPELTLFPNVEIPAGDDISLEVFTVTPFSPIEAGWNWEVWGIPL